jgi:hypothetical protein
LYGFHDASASAETVRAWKARFPTANWAVATGRVNGFIVSYALGALDAA